MKISSVCLLLVSPVVVACATTGPAPKMSFEEARDVVLSMQNVPLEPPPRKMNDILALLERDRHGAMDDIVELMRRADMEVPFGKDHDDRYQFFKSRGYARYELSRFKESREDIRLAMENGQFANIKDTALYRLLAELEMNAGRYESARELSRTSRKMLRATGWEQGPYMAFESRVIHRMGNFSLAKRYIERAHQSWGRVPKFGRHSHSVYGGDMGISNQIDIIAAEAELLEVQGQYRQAHPLRSMVLNFHFRIRKTKPLGVVYARLALSGNLMHQGRLIPAEKEARTAVTEAVRISGGQSSITAVALQTLGEIILAKGDLPNADILSTTQVAILISLELSNDEDIMIRARLFRAGVESTGYDFSAAMTSYDLALEGMDDNPYFFKRYACRNPGLILTLIKNRRISEAETLIRMTRDTNRLLGMDNPYEAAELQALEAMALKAKNQPDKARSLFAKAIPDLLTIIQDPNSNFEKRRRADMLLQFYIDSLLERVQGAWEKEDSVAVADEILKLADARYSRVNSALGESSARAASLADPELAELVRQEQDAGKKLRSLEAAFYNATAARADTSGSGLHDLERTIKSLAEARASIIARIEKDFPRYASYIHPKPPGIAKIQEHLAPGEAFVAIWTMANKTCVWAMLPRGDPAFTVVDLGKAEVRQKVNILRRSLRPNVRLLSEIPEFDLEIAYDLYERLLQPVESGWKDARSLLVVVRGPLDLIPLAVLPTENVKPEPDRTLRFDKYRQVPWLIRKTSITRLPSAAALLTLRALPPADPGRDPFAGFGDPIFSLAQLHQTPVKHATPSQTGISTGDIAIRGIRISDKGEELDSDKLSSVRIEQLCRLPDTADEIRQIAASLHADPSRDVFLGKAATETAIKTRDFSRKKILAFATHALLPGDLDGLTQPALAFSSPEVTELDEDGLLTVGEILTLKLDADLVVLSACDTGAGDGSGSEAVSGLGRAFFYSGARALLVTMWPVETTSANKLTTGLFQIRQEQPGLSWARAQQQSILRLMEDHGLKNTKGDLVASYAHPIFWGPFVVIGASGVQ